MTLLYSYLVQMNCLSDTAEHRWQAYKHWHGEMRDLGIIRCHPRLAGILRQGIFPLRGKPRRWRLLFYQEAWRMYMSVRRCVTSPRNCICLSLFRPRKGCQVLWWVCLLVCPLAYNSKLQGRTSPNFFCARCLWSWFGPSLTRIQTSYSIFNHHKIIFYSICIKPRFVGKNCALCHCHFLWYWKNTPKMRGHYSLKSIQVFLQVWYNEVFGFAQSILKFLRTPLQGQQNSWT